MKKNNLTLLAMFATIALALSAVEGMLPPLTAVPGIKMGLANVVTLILLNFCRPTEVLIVLVVRILLSSMFGGQMMSFLYSLCGGLCCFAVMSVLNRILERKHLILTSIGGALAHNTAQILVARVLVGSASVYTYIPILTISGMVTGAFTGTVAVYACRYYKIFSKYM